MFSLHRGPRRGARRARLALGAALLAGLVSCGGGTDPGAAQAPEPPNVLVVLTDDQPVGMTPADADPELDPRLRALRLLLRQQPALLPDPRHAADRALLPPHRGGDESRRRRTSTTPRRSPPGWTRPVSRPASSASTSTTTRGNGRPATCPRAGTTGRRSPPTPPTTTTRLVRDQGTETHGEAPADYSTDVLAAHVDDFIRSAQQPFFAWFAPYAPHAPRTPAPRDRDAFAGARVKLPANFNRVAAGAPRWWKQRPRLDRGEERRATLGQWRSLQAVDDAIGRFVETLRAQDELDNTVIVFLSDNGYSLGSHRNPWKDCAYEECVHLPLLDPLARPHRRRPADRRPGREHGHRADDRRARRRHADHAARRHQPRPAAHRRAHVFWTGRSCSATSTTRTSPRPSGVCGPSAGPTSSTRRAAASSTTTRRIRISCATSRAAAGSLASSAPCTASCGACAPVESRCLRSAGVRC